MGRRRTVQPIAGTGARQPVPAANAVDSGSGVAVVDGVAVTVVAAETVTLSTTRSSTVTVSVVSSTAVASLTTTSSAEPVCETDAFPPLRSFASADTVTAANTENTITAVSASAHTRWFALAVILVVPRNTVTGPALDANWLFDEHVADAYRVPSGIRNTVHPPIFITDN